MRGSYDMLELHSRMHQLQREDIAQRAAAAANKSASGAGAGAGAGASSGDAINGADEEQGGGGGLFTQGPLGYAKSLLLAVGLGRKCSKCPSTQFKPSILELNSTILDSEHFLPGPSSRCGDASGNVTSPPPGVTMMLPPLAVAETEVLGTGSGTRATLECCASPRVRCLVGVARQVEPGFSPLAFISRSYK